MTLDCPTCRAGRGYCEEHRPEPRIRIKRINFEHERLLEAFVLVLEEGYEDETLYVHAHRYPDGGDSSTRRELTPREFVTELYDRALAVLVEPDPTEDAR